MNQHYLPQFYLKQFATVGPARQGQFLWVLSDGVWRERAPNRTASAPDFYGNSVDNELGIVENKIARVFSAFCLSPPDVLAEEQRQTISLFMAQLGLRVPGFIDPFAEGVKQVYTKLISNQKQQFLEQPESFEAMKKLLKEKRKIDCDDLKIEDFDSNQWDWEVPNGYVVGSVLPTLLPVAETYEAMKWTLLCIDAPGFVTSDFPVAMHSPNQGLFSGGLEDPDVELTFPLSPKLALLCTHSGENSYSKVSANADQVLRMNLRTVNGSSKFHVISHAKVFPGSEIIESKLITKIVIEEKARKDNDG